MPKKHKTTSKTPSKSDPTRVSLTEFGKQNKNRKERKLSCLDAAAAVLKAAGMPMTTKAMIDAMFAKKLWHSDAPTPAATLYSAILRELKAKGSKARFKKTARGLFALVVTGGAGKASVAKR